MNTLTPDHKWNPAALSSLHTICPYFTMFPLEFPLSIIRSVNSRGWILDPFCGRGTTNFAARVFGQPSVGIDSSPVAVAIARAKLADTTPADVVRAAKHILLQKKNPVVPAGRFWKRCFHPETLLDLCTLRDALLDYCESDTRTVLKALILGALHGPLTKGDPSYFSNQCPRTYAPKPDYAVRFWQRHGFKAPHADTLQLIRTRAHRFLENKPSPSAGKIIHGDSRDPKTMHAAKRFSLVITSPPYYGMRTYIPDQWLRNWFVGGPSEVLYRTGERELSHAGPKSFAAQLRTVWTNAAAVSKPSAQLVIRFGGINDRDNDPREIIKESLANTPWRISTIRGAGTAKDGKRQADQFQRVKKNSILELDAYARLN